MSEGQRSVYIVALKDAQISAPIISAFERQNFQVTSFHDHIELLLHCGFITSRDDSFPKECGDLETYPDLLLLNAKNKIIGGPLNVFNILRAFENTDVGSVTMLDIYSAIENKIVGEIGGQKAQVVRVKNKAEILRMRDKELFPNKIIKAGMASLAQVEVDKEERIKNPPTICEAEEAYKFWKKFMAMQKSSKTAAWVK